MQVAALKAVGSNAWRTAHNPVAPELLDYTDEYGMLVWEENRFVTAGVQPLLRHNAAVDDSSRLASIHGRGEHSRYGYSPPTVAAADPRLLQDAQDMALRDRNHPSIIIWSLCNELGCVADDPNGGVLAAQFKQAIAAADPSRPITGNTVQTPYLSGRLVDSFAMAMDVQSFSYDYFAYAGFHSMTPWKAVGGGEAGSCTLDRGQYRQPGSEGEGYVGPEDETTGANKQFGGLFGCARASWITAAQTEYAYGNFLWTGFDYRGETSHGWPDVSSKFGMYDLAGFAKDSAGYYRAWWRDWNGAKCREVDGAVSHEDREYSGIGGTEAQTGRLFFSHPNLDWPSWPRFGSLHFWATDIAESN